MKRDRVEEIRTRFGEMLHELLDSVEVVEDKTLKDLKDEDLERFRHGGLYEFSAYREDIGGRIIFECIKEDGKTFFNERYRIYRISDIYGIEERDNPSYLEAVGGTIYSRIPPGSVVLDLGCGTAKYLKKINSTERTVLAIDISEDIIEDNRRAPGLENIHFIAGDIRDLSPIDTGEADYVTGINLLNALSIDSTVELLVQSRRVAKKGLLFGFTLPTQADLWSDISPENMAKVVAGINDPDATPEEMDLAVRHSFTGQMNLFMFMKAIARQKNWTIRIFRFLDRFTIEEDDFLKTDDSRYIGYKNNGLFKLLELPLRKAARVEGVPDGSVLVHAVGYGMEVYFSPEDALNRAEGVYYFDDDTDFSKFDMEEEMKRSIEFWGLPFEVS